MYPLVGAINYKHHKTIDADYVLLRLAIVTEQDLTKLDANAQKSLRTNTVARFNQNDELRRWLLNIRSELIRLYRTQPPFKVVLENDKPTQVIVETDGILARFVPDASGKLTKLDRYNLLPQLYVDGKDIKRKDTSEVVQLKGVDIPSPLDSTWATKGDNRYFFGVITVAKAWNANHVKLLFRAIRVVPLMEDTKRLVEDAERKGMYVFITGGGVGIDGGNCKCGYDDIPMPNDEVIAALVNLAQDFKSYNNVILDVWNEPVNDPVGNRSDPNKVTDFKKQLYDVNVKAIKAIRSANDSIVIVVTGANYGQDFIFYNLLPPLPDSNLIFRTQQTWPMVQDKDFDEVLARWKFLIGVRPVMIGEWGQGGGPEGQTADASRWYERTLNELVNPNHLSYSQYVLGFINPQVIRLI